MTHFVSALFETRGSAELAIRSLESAAFERRDISVLMIDPAPPNTVRAAGSASASTVGVPMRAAATGAEQAPIAPGSTFGAHTAEGVAIGAATGGTVGALLASLLAVGTLAVPGLAFVAAGPLVAALAGAGAGGAAGSLIGALVGAGIPESHASFMDHRIRRGGVLVGVYATDDRAELAREILHRAGGASAHPADMLAAAPG